MAVVGEIFKLSCAVELNGADLNVFLIGNEIEEKKDELKVVMGAKSGDDYNDDYTILAPTTEIANLLKYQNVDGAGPLNKDSTYVVLASYKLEEQEIKQKAKEISENNQNCQTIATGDPCVVCFNSSN